MDFEQYLRDMIEKQREFNVPHKAEVVLRIETGALVVRIKPAMTEGAEFTDYVAKGNTLEPR